MSFKWTSPSPKTKDPIPQAAPVVAAGGVEVEAVICQLKTMADGGLRVSLDLPEIDPALFALLYALRNKAVRINIK